MQQELAHFPAEDSENDTKFNENEEFKSEYPNKRAAISTALGLDT